MHITLETDYAVRIVDVLARHKLSAAGGSPPRLDAGTIADKTGVPISFSLKILRKLVSGEIVRSYKGVRGGYELCGEPSDISLYSVMKAVQGDYRFSRCLEGGYLCSCKPEDLSCSYQQAFADISETVKEKLCEYTFDKLIHYTMNLDINNGEI